MKRAQGTKAPEPPGVTGGGWRLTAGTVLSLVLHAAAFAYIQWYATTPDVGLEFQLPAQVELGLTEAVDPAAAPPPSAEPSAPEATEGNAGGDAVAADAGTDPPDAEEESEEEDGSPREQLAASEGEEDGSTDDGDGFGTEALPPGAQLALRMDMKRIRRSPIADDVRRLLDTIPDWKAVLGGSGIEPVDDLSRVLIASPDLRRDKAVVAGRHTGGRSLPREIVARMAAARGEEASWGRRSGVPVADWPDQDATRRVIAVIGPEHFAISRPQDLPRVLAVAQARQDAQRADGGTDEPRPDVGAWGDALLSMGEDEALTLEVEGARHFVRGPMRERFPSRLRLAVVDAGGGRVKLTGEGTYEDADQARAALDYADRVRSAYARNTFVRLAGVARPLEEATLELDDEVLRFETELGLGQIRLALGYVEGLLARGRPSPPGPAQDSGGDATDAELGGEPEPNPYRTP
ncbi:MAG: hypothetical protein ACOC97_05025 [Myxococcota bacterium]